jgi:L-ascorbate metabolism protein UlaG (beta-lactamase superfamily)
MEIQYYGANCVRITTKKASITIDDNLSDLGAKSPMRAGDIAVFTGAHGEASVAPKLVIDQPGEYEVSDTSVYGIAARAHIDEPSQQTATIFKIVGDDIRLVALGHIYPDLSEAQLETLGTVDILLIPVGGNGYTLDPIGALKLIKKIEPKLIIPTHFADKGLKYPVPQQELANALHELSMEPKETVPKIKIKAGELADITQLIVLERQQ